MIVSGSQAKRFCTHRGSITHDRDTPSPRAPVGDTLQCEHNAGLLSPEYIGDAEPTKQKLMRHSRRAPVRRAGHAVSKMLTPVSKAYLCRRHKIICVARVDGSGCRKIDILPEADFPSNGDRRRSYPRDGRQRAQTPEAWWPLG